MFESWKRLAARARLMRMAERLGTSCAGEDVGAVSANVNGRLVIGRNDLGRQLWWVNDEGPMDLESAAAACSEGE